MDAVTRVTFYDALIAFVVAVIVLAIVIMAIMGEDVPQYLVDAFAACIGWVLRGGAQVANEFIHRKRSVTNDGSVPPSADGAGGSAGGWAGGSGDAV